MNSSEAKVLKIQDLLERQKLIIDQIEFTVRKLEEEHRATVALLKPQEITVRPVK